MIVFELADTTDPTMVSALGFGGRTTVRILDTTLEAFLTGSIQVGAIALDGDLLWEEADAQRLG